MAKFSRLAGATSQSVNVFLSNCTSTTGLGLTGIVASNITATYSFTGVNAAATAISLTEMLALTSAYASGGWIEINASTMNGVYRLDLPNASLAAAKGNTVVFVIQDATAAQSAKVAPCLFEVELTAWDNQTAIISANSVQTNSISNSSVTTVNANQGTTQPINFTYTGASALVDVDLKDIVGSAVSTTVAQLGVNVVQYNAQTAATDANNLPKINVTDWNGTAVGALPTNFSSFSIDSSGRVTLAPGQLFVKKNTALNNFPFLMISSTDDISPKTGLTWGAGNSQVSIDGGAFANTANSPSEIGNGMYKINLATTDTNGTVLIFRFNGTGALDTEITVITQA